MGSGFDRFIDFEDLAVFADVVSPSKWNGPAFIHNSKCFGSFFTRVTQNGVIQF